MNYEHCLRILKRAANCRQAKIWYGCYPESSGGFAGRAKVSCEACFYAPDVLVRRKYSPAIAEGSAVELANKELGKIGDRPGEDCCWERFRNK